ncbi:MAG: hypothetical protein NWF13_04775 [Candidatus Bathyarchaeota archaeon]|nr:hypothetical protein [Candidatus Bathyarchaeota archaeon]
MPLSLVKNGGSQRVLRDYSEKEDSAICRPIHSMAVNTRGQGDTLQGSVGAYLNSQLKS